MSQYNSAVVAFNQQTESVQSDNLPINALGIYDNPAFGKTTAHYVTQLSLATLAPTIGANASVESVYISIPYFSTVISTSTEGVKSYKLDSIHGPTEGKIKLSIYESGYFIRKLDPTTKEDKPFYSYQNTLFDNAKKGSPLNNSSNTNENNEFFFDSKPILTSTVGADGKTTTVASRPAMRLKLDNKFFQDKILNAPRELVSDEVFKNYFKGLYFKVESVSGSSGRMAKMNFAEGKITISYKEDLNTNGTITRVSKTLDLNLSSNGISLLEQTDTNTAYTNAVANPNATVGDPSLYLKGGQGSMAVISLFSTPGEIQSIRDKGWLINEANLIFNIDAAKMANSEEPRRVYLYNLTHNVPLIDYYDATKNIAQPKNNRYLFSGIINKEKATNGRGQTYKIRITNHIRNLIKHADSTNVKLGLVVTENIEDASFVKLKTAHSFSSKVTRASVMNPLGTILYGTHPSVPEDKKIKLQIYYTKPN